MVKFSYHFFVVFPVLAERSGLVFYVVGAISVQVNIVKTATQVSGGRINAERATLEYSCAYCA